MGLILLKIIKFRRIVQKWRSLQINFANIKEKIFMNKLFATIILFFSIGAARAQFYYKDILSNQQLTADMMAYKQHKIHTIKLKSYESDDSPSEGFLCEKTISKDFKKSELFTRSDISAISLFTSFFNDKAQLLSSIDSSNISVTYNHYTYDAAGRLQKIESSVRSSDDDFTNEIFQEHIYEYNTQGAIVSMMLVKNRHDSTKILFQSDEHNNIILEKNTRDGSKYYYYYDTKNRLTDVTHTNEYRGNMVADYIFEYNAAGQVTQMTITEEGRGMEQNDTAPKFFIWRYTYDNGLRSKEGLFSKDRQLMGTVEYEYK